MRLRRIVPLACVVGLLLGLASPARAIPVAYRISGVLTGQIGSIFDVVNLVDAPFEITIAADTAGAFRIGSVAGVGSAFVNDSDAATWTVAGVGTARSESVQVFSFPGVARVGFGWNGEVLPFDTAEPAERILQFRSPAFTVSSSGPDYSRLDAVVPAVSLSLVTELRNPPNTVPGYTTYIQFPDSRPLLLMELNELSYEVVALPEGARSAPWLASIAVLLAARRSPR